MTSRRTVALALLALTALTSFDVATGLQWPGAPFLALAFVLFVPGGAVVGNLRLGSPAAELSAAMALSLAIVIGVAEAMLWVHAWDPDVAQLVIAAGCIPLLVRQVAVSSPAHAFGALEGDG